MKLKDFNHEYRGFKLKIYDRSYKVFQTLPNGKFKMIRHKCTYAKPQGDDHNGKLYKRYESDEVALQKAKDYIDQITTRLKYLPLTFRDENNPFNGLGNGEWDDYAHTADDL